MSALHDNDERRPDAWRGLLREQALVGGDWVGAAGGGSIEVLDPATGGLVGRVPRLGSDSARDAIAAARDAFPAWRALLPRQRGDILMDWRRLMLEHADELAALMTAEQGKPLADARGEIEYGAEFVRWFAEEASRVYGETIPSHLPGRKMFVQREPVGVVGLVTPWNFPSAMLTRKAAAALAAGCTAVAVPSMETPFSALALAALAEEAGVPSGVFSVLTGDAEVLVRDLCAHPDVRAVSFTGSTRIGRLIAAQCALTLKRVSLELGGHAPFMVFADADLEAAAKAAVAAKYQTSGQDCLAANRIFVHASVYTPFVEAFVRAAARLRVGAGTDPGADLGPLINAATCAKSAEHVADAVAKGARLALGGAPDAGLFFPPTVLADVPPDAKIMHEETFGPVAAIAPFTDEAAVVRAANDTQYGLVAYVFTRDLSRAHRLIDALEYGMVAVNTMKLTGAPIPFGGVKQSGLGREGSRHGIEEYTELKYACVAIDDR
ncbi:MAG TPA: NAD-dependent succinate-semialdehyde dehydrogenase [Caulobacteraceae bacterium]|jgi:succinate-semialdehyde dehydrogenase